MAISRRQIISAGQHVPVGAHDQDEEQQFRHLQQQQQAGKTTNRRRDQQQQQQNSNNMQQSTGGKQSRTVASSSGKQAPQRGASNHFKSQQQVDSLGNQLGGQTESSDGYVIAGHSQCSSSNQTYEEYLGEQDAQNYRHFDPYSIYSEEEDVWYSEERIFEDHLEEIHNKWSLLDDDIWCKLIIMERNRRIGKAYARVPLVTIDGSHELSYDGYKLALNGFDNPDRDDETEQCRKRIGKGIRIKMDDYGNILIKRLSKSGVYIKEWLNASTSSGSSNSTNASSGAGVGRSMPSRQQLIKNSELGAAMAASAAAAAAACSGSSSAASSAAVSMEPPNDSAICDEVLSVRGRLELEKIYVLFDMKKFQANLSQELCRPYPSRRKLEQQCFSIVGLARDSEEVLNLPCWVMVINIVALEMLYGKFPMLSPQGDERGADLGAFVSGNAASAANAAAASRYGQRSSAIKLAPNFLSVFDEPQTSCSGGQRRQAMNSKEEDPYSLPANASSSDVKSSSNDNYGTASTKNIGSYVGASHSRQQQHLMGGLRPAGMGPRRLGAAARLPGTMQTNKYQQQAELAAARHRSKSNNNIYGQMGAAGSRTVNQTRAERYNNSTSIYSPGHMLVQSSGDQLPPKLPPRDFVAKKARSKSSSNVSGEQRACMSPAPTNGSETIYSTGNAIEAQQQASNAAQVQARVPARKTKRNRFLESLRAPLELARSSSVLGSGLQPMGTLEQQAAALESAPSRTKATGCSGAQAKKSGAKNLRSFLGVGGSKSSTAPKVKDTTSEESNYVRVDKSPAGDIKQASTKAANSKRGPTGSGNAGQLGKTDNGGEADSVVDSNEEIDESQQMVTNSSNSSAASYNDLDIPTPDYETDENIYALNAGLVAPALAGPTKLATGSRRARRFSASHKAELQAPELPTGPKSKDDLYFSGLLAHVPQNIYGHHQQQKPQAGGGQHRRSASSQLLQSPYASSTIGGGGGVEQLELPSRGAATAKRLGGQRQSRLGVSSKGREQVYGSAIGLPSMTGARYRSASMQRCYAQPAARAYHQRHLQAYELGDEMYPLESYAMSGAGGPADHYELQNHCDHSMALGLRAPRRRLAKKSLLAETTNSIADGRSPGHYDLGHSSSGIYGNNSSSSSCDYADWHPQVRKVNSSGYLNSVFKTGAIPAAAHNQQQQQQDLHDSQTNPLNSNNNAKIGAPSRIYGSGGGVNNNNNITAKSLSRNYTSKTLKAGAPSSPLTANGANSAKPTSTTEEQHNERAAINGQPAYRSYDSSNDSDPSYTNSSDGLDIYDHIGAHARASNSSEHHRRHNQFIEHGLAPEVHVGEWENMYSR